MCSGHSPRDQKEKEKRKESSPSKSLPCPVKSTVSRTRPFQTSSEQVLKSPLTGYEGPKTYQPLFQIAEKT